MHIACAVNRCSLEHQVKVEASKACEGKLCLASTTGAISTPNVLKQIRAPEGKKMSLVAQDECTHSIKLEADMCLLALLSLLDASTTWALTGDLCQNWQKQNSLQCTASLHANHKVGICVFRFSLVGTALGN